MSEQNWYLYQNKEQLGPYTSDHLRQMHLDKMIAQDAYVFKVGWKDWRPVEETLHELGVEDEPSAPASSARRLGAPRASINGRIIIHNNGQVSIGNGVNISATGIFIETTDEIFQIGEDLKLSVKVDGVHKPFNVSARVIRFNRESNMPCGYGLQFNDIAPEIRAEIQTLVERTTQQPLAEEATESAS